MKNRVIVSLVYLPLILLFTSRSSGQIAPMDTVLIDTVGFNAWHAISILDTIYNDTALLEYDEEESDFTPYARWKDFVLHRLDSNGSMDSYLDHYDSILQERVASRTIPAISSTGCIKDGVYNETWEKFGYSWDDVPATNQNGNFGVGWVYDVSYANGIWYAGAKNGGLWKSTDNGLNWFFAGDDLFEGRGVNNIEPNPAVSGDIVLSCAHGEHNGMGIFRTKDGGQTWVRTLNMNYYIKQIFRSPTNSDELYAISDVKLYKSTDGGDSWNDITLHISASQIVCDVCNTNTNPNIYLFDDIEIIFDPTISDIRIFLGGNLNIYSDDHGSTWSNFSFNYSRSTSKPCISSVYFASGTNGVIYVHYAAYNSSNNTLAHIIEKSSDYGITWTTRFTAGNSGAFNPKASPKVSLGDNNILLIPGVPFVIFNNITQTRYTRSGIHDDIRDLYSVDFGTYEKLFVASDGGVSSVVLNYSDPNRYTSNWQFVHHNNGLQIQQIYTFDMESDEKDNIDMYMGVQDNGTIRGIDNQFYYSFGGGDGGLTICNPDGDGYLKQGNSVLYNASGSYVPLAFFQEFRDPGQYFRNSQTLYMSGQLRTEAGNGALQDNMSATLISNPFNPSTKRSSADVNVNPNFEKRDPQALIIFETNQVDHHKFWTFHKTYDGSPQCYEHTYDPINGWLTIGKTLLRQNGNSIWGVSATAINRTTGDIWLGLEYIENGSARVLKLNQSTGKYDDFSSGLSSRTNGVGNLPINKLVYDEKMDVLFACTDMGVFYRSSQMSDWKELGNGFPLVRVNDLYVNWNTFEIYVGTYGRGMYKIPIPCCEDNSNIPVDRNIITNEVHEYESRFIAENWIITAGNTVTLTGCDYSFCEDCKIIVEPGAKLMVNKSTLGPGCKDATWLGIEVWGDPLANSSIVVQGHIDISNSYIVNAYNGILTGNNIDNLKNGGIVYSTDNEFINCRIGVNFKPFGNPSKYNISIIQSTKFNFKDLIWAGNGLNHHIAIVENFGVRIVGCDFINVSGNATNMDRGRGIQCVDGSFRLTGISTGPFPCMSPESEIRKNNFIGLSHGVKTIDFSQNSKYTIVSESNFKNCNTSVWINSYGVKKVNRNYIVVDAGLGNQDPLLYYNLKPMGIFSVDVGDLLIDSNHIRIMPDYNNVDGYFGIWCKSTFPSVDPSYIYMNTVEVDNQLSGPLEPLNAGTNQTYGLCFEESNPNIDLGCNTFERLNYDLYFDVDPALGEMVPSSLPVSGSFKNTDLFSNYNTLNTFNGYSNYHLLPSGSHIFEAANFSNGRNFNVGNYGSGFLVFTSNADNRNGCLLTNRCVIHEYARSFPGQQDVLLPGDGDGGVYDHDLTIKPEEKDIYETNNAHKSFLNIQDSTVNRAASSFAEIVGENYNNGGHLNSIPEEDLERIGELYCSLEFDERQKASELFKLNNYQIPICQSTESSTSFDMIVYPNPNNGTFMVKYELGNSSSGVIVVNSALGQMLSSFNISDKKGSREVSGNWAPGIYFVTLILESGERITRTISIY